MLTACKTSSSKMADSDGEGLTRTKRPQLGSFFSNGHIIKPRYVRWDINRLWEVADMLGTEYHRCELLGKRIRT